MLAYNYCFTLFKDGFHEPCEGLTCGIIVTLMLWIMFESSNKLHKKKHNYFNSHQNQKFRLSCNSWILIIKTKGM